MIKLEVIERIKKDCKEKGHGRKKWWADNLGVHQQTLSYWLHGHRTPSREHFQDIDNLSSILNNEKELKAWRDFLFHIYYGKQQIPIELLVECIKKLLSSQTIDSRTLGFLSFIIEKTNIQNIDDLNPLLRNRIGWLLEVSGVQPCFKPYKSKTLPLVRTPLKYDDPRTKIYLKRIQTIIGKRWKVYDCDVSGIRSSYIGEFLSANS